MGERSPSVPRAVSGLIMSFVPLSLGQGFLFVVIGAWLVTVGFSPVQAGALFSVQGMAMIASSIPFGVVSDVYGRKRLLVLGAVAGAAALMAFSLTTDFSLMVAACAVLGLSEGASITTWNALLADLTDDSNRNNAFSFSFVATNVSMGVGLLLPGLFPLLEVPLGLTDYAIHRDALLLLGVASFATPALCALVLRTFAESHGPGRTWSGLRNKGSLAKLGFVSGTIGLGAGFIIPLIGSWFYFRFDVSDSYSGPILAVSNIMIGSSAAASPWLARRFGQLAAILLTTGSSMLFMISMAFIPFFALAAGVYIVRSALMNMSGPLLDSFSMSIFPPEQRGVVSAATNIIFRLPNSISTYVGGLILGMGLLQLPFFIAGSLYAVGLGGLYAFFMAGGRHSRGSVSTLASREGAPS